MDNQMLAPAFIIARMCLPERTKSPHPDSMQNGSPDYNLRNKLLLLIFFRVLDIAFAVFPLEPLNTTGRIDIFLLSCVKRMAHRTDFCVNFFRRTARLERIAAPAVNDHFIIFWMYLFFHNFITPKYLKRSILTDFPHISTKIFRKSFPAGVLIRIKEFWKFIYKFLWIAGLTFPDYKNFPSLFLQETSIFLMSFFISL